MRLVPALFLLNVVALFAQAPAPRPTRASAGMEKANQVAGKMVRMRLEFLAANDLRLLESVVDSDVLVVEGSMDHLETVLDAEAIPFRVLAPTAIDSTTLDPSRQIVMINCPGRGFSFEGLAKLTRFVRAGGWLVTTDWALGSVLEQAFPGYVRHGNISTGDEVVGVQLFDDKHPLVKGVMDSSSSPRWWLEGTSETIVIQRPEQVRILIQSPEMEERYGLGAVAVHFEFGMGTVFHITSHIQLQRADSAGTGGSAANYASALVGKEISPASSAAISGELDGVSAGELESAYTCQKFVANIILENRRRREPEVTFSDALRVLSGRR